MLENQNNVVREVQETISSMNQIVKNTREELLMTSNSNQLLMTENMRNITKALEVVKDNLFAKMSNLDKALQNARQLADEVMRHLPVRIISTTPKKRPWQWGRAA